MLCAGFKRQWLNFNDLFELGSFIPASETQQLTPCCQKNGYREYPLFREYLISIEIYQLFEQDKYKNAITCKKQIKNAKNIR